MGFVHMLRASSASQVWRTCPAMDFCGNVERHEEKHITVT